jgi:diaminopimelate decarboxylase
LIERKQEPRAEVDSSSNWWRREDLFYKGNQLHFAGAPVVSWLYGEQTPAYLYNWQRIQENIRRLREALQSTEKAYRIFYAMKSNRHAPLLTSLAQMGNVGIDACSHAEIEAALSCGFRDEHISFTATGVAREEWKQVLSHHALRVNADSLSDLEKIGNISPGRTVGIRLNPAAGIGYRQNPLLRYADADTLSKFGIPLEDITTAYAIAAKYDLKIDGLHIHSGCGYLSDQLPALQNILETLKPLWQQFKIQSINLGGGLGIPLVTDDEPLDLNEWSAVLRSGLKGFDGEIWIEPGDYIVKDSGILVTTVTQSLVRRHHRYISVNAGFNIHPEPVFYDLPLHPLPTLQRPGEPSSAILAGNINEVHDLWAKNIVFPPVEEGDHIAFLNAGGYGAAMSSHHCLRGNFTERLIL